MWSDIFIIHSKSSPIENSIARKLISIFDDYGYFTWLYKDWRWATPDRVEYSSDYGEEIDVERYMKGEVECLTTTKRGGTDLDKLHHIFAKTRLVLVIHPIAKPTSGVRAEAGVVRRDCPRLRHREILPVRFLCCRTSQGKIHDLFKGITFDEILEIALTAEGKPCQADILAIASTMAFYLLRQRLDSLGFKSDPKELSRADALYRGLLHASIDQPASAAYRLRAELDRLDALIASQNMPRFCLVRQIELKGPDQVTAMFTCPHQDLVVAQIVQKQVKKGLAFDESYKNEGQVVRVLHGPEGQIVREYPISDWESGRLVFSTNCRQLLSVARQRVVVFNLSLDEQFVRSRFDADVIDANWLDERTVIVVLRAWVGNEEQLEIKLLDTLNGDEIKSFLLPRTFSNVGGASCSASGTVVFEVEYGGRIEVFKVLYRHQLMASMTIEAKRNGNNNVVFLNSDDSIVFHVRNHSSPSITAFSMESGLEVGSADYPFGRYLQEWRTMGCYVALSLSAGQGRNEVPEVWIYRMDEEGLHYLASEVERRIDAMDLVVTEQAVLVPIVNNGSVSYLKINESPPPGGSDLRG